MLLIKQVIALAVVTAAPAYALPGVLGPSDPIIRESVTRAMASQTTSHSGSDLKPRGTSSSASVQTSSSASVQTSFSIPYFSVIAAMDSEDSAMDATTTPFTSEVTGVSVTIASEASTTGPSTTEAAPAAASTWLISVNMGPNNFYIGDAPQSTLDSLIATCNDPTGCAGDAQTFRFNWTETEDNGSSYADPATGTINMDGNVGDDGFIEGALVSAIQAALQAATQCNTTQVAITGDDCTPPGLPKRTLTGPEGDQDPCPVVPIPACIAPGAINAVMYDALSGGDVKGSLQFTGNSTNPVILECSTTITAVNDAFGSVGTYGLANDISAVAKAFCT